MKSRLSRALVVKHVSMVHCSSQASHNLPASRLTGRIFTLLIVSRTSFARIDIAGGTVETIVGGDLFEFGDVDGSGDEVRLQHPLGCALFRRQTSDRRHVQPQDQATRSEEGNRHYVCLEQASPARQDGTSASFYEPGGLALANDKLYIADTNNHAIRVVDLKTKRASTLRINGLTPPAKNMQALESATGPNAEEIKVAAQKLRAGAGGFSANRCGTARRLSSQSAWRRSATRFRSRRQEFGD